MNSEDIIQYSRGPGKETVCFQLAIQANGDLSRYKVHTISSPVKGILFGLLQNNAKCSTKNLEGFDSAKVWLASI